MKNVVLFGGSFNPPHKAHRQVVEHLLRSHKFDEVWLLPVYDHPFGKNLPAFKTRLTLCRLLIEGLNHSRVCSIEGSLKKSPSYTIDVIRALKKKYPDIHWTLALGSDCKKDLSRWKNIKQLKKEVSFYFLPRPGFEKSPFRNISSSELREKIRAGKKVSNDLIPAVENCIRQKKLYMDDLIRKVCIIYKKSVYQKYIASNKNPHLKKLYYQNHPLTRRFQAAHRAHSHTLEEVIRILQEHQIETTVESRKGERPLTHYDLIITVGGDGTFLKTSHRVGHQLMLGVNSAPKASVGALLSTRWDEFPEKIKMILQGHYHVALFNRIDISVNGKKIQAPALNDVLLSHLSPAGVTRYKIEIGNRKEVQRSSGIWMSTAAGSTAAIRAAGGKKMNPSSGEIQYLVREPVRVKGKMTYRLVNGFIKEGEKIKLTNQTIEAALYIDGTQTVIPLKFGDKIVLQKSLCPLRHIP